MDRSEVLDMLQINFEKRTEITDKINLIKGKFNIDELDAIRLNGLREKREELWEEQQILLQKFKECV